MIEIITDVDPIPRVETGFYSFDRAFTGANDEDIGMPYGTGYEIFGQTGVGKSTFCYSISGLLSKLIDNDTIGIGDLEGFSRDYLRIVLQHSGFEGKVKIIRKAKDEEMLEALLDVLTEQENTVGILDSIGAISPISEKDSEIGSANMGKRAYILAQFVRKLLPYTREFNTTLFGINHWYPRIGSYGWATPGGEVKKYIMTIRILLKQKEQFDDGSYVLEGQVYKNRWGKSDKKFHLFSLAGKGLHKGMTAIIDGANVNKCPITRSTTVKIGDESYGYLSNIIKEAQDGNDEFFEPFLEAIHGKEERK